MPKGLDDVIRLHNNAYSKYAQSGTRFDLSSTLNNNKVGEPNLNQYFSTINTLFNKHNLTPREEQKLENAYEMVGRAHPKKNKEEIQKLAAQAPEQTTTSTRFSLEQRAQQYLVDRHIERLRSASKKRRERMEGPKRSDIQPQKDPASKLTSEYKTAIQNFLENNNRTQSALRNQNKYDKFTAVSDTAYKALLKDREIIKRMKEEIEPKNTIAFHRALFEISSQKPSFNR